MSEVPCICYVIVIVLFSINSTITYVSINHFEFNTKLYLQISGTAMGTFSAPSLVNLFMGNLEQIPLSDCQPKPLIWLRFIDDIFLIWTHDEDELNRFVQYATQVHYKIKFTCNKSKSHVTFLDIKVVLDPLSNKLYTTLYTKPTEMRDVLYYMAMHLLSTKVGGRYGQFLRIRHICTKD